MLIAGTTRTEVFDLVSGKPRHVTPYDATSLMSAILLLFDIAYVKDV